MEDVVVASMDAQLYVDFCVFVLEFIWCSLPSISVTSLRFYSLRQIEVWKYVLCYGLICRSLKKWMLRTGEESSLLLTRILARKKNCSLVCLLPYLMKWNMKWSDLWRMEDPIFKVLFNSLRAGFEWSKGCISRVYDICESYRDDWENQYFLLKLNLKTSKSIHLVSITDFIIKSIYPINNVWKASVTKGKQAYS